MRKKERKKRGKKKSAPPLKISGFATGHWQAQKSMARPGLTCGRGTAAARGRACRLRASDGSFVVALLEKSSCLKPSNRLIALGKEPKGSFSDRRNLR